MKIGKIKVLEHSDEFRSRKPNWKTKTFFDKVDNKFKVGRKSKIRSGNKVNISLVLTIDYDKFDKSTWGSEDEIALDNNTNFLKKILYWSAGDEKKVTKIVATNDYNVRCFSKIGSDIVYISSMDVKRIVDKINSRLKDNTPFIKTLKGEDDKLIGFENLEDLNVLFKNTRRKESVTNVYPGGNKHETLKSIIDIDFISEKELIDIKVKKYSKQFNRSENQVRYLLNMLDGDFNRYKELELGFKKFHYFHVPDKIDCQFIIAKKITFDFIDNL